MANNKPASTLLRNARIVLADRTIESGNLLIENGRIARVYYSADGGSSSDPTFDLTGLSVFPGFIDVHIHGALGVDTLDADCGDLLRVGEFLAQNGVTTWLPTLVPAKPEQYEQAVRAISDTVAQTSVCDSAISHHRLKPVARVLGVHYEGPFVNSDQCGALHREYFRTFQKLEDLNSLPVINHAEAIHMMTVAPEIDGGIELIKELKRQRWVVSSGHTKASPDILDEARSAGARHMTHFMNAMTPLHHRSPGPVDWGLMNDDVTCDLIADGIHLDPAILKLILRNKTSERVSLISDAIAAAGLGDGEYQIWGETIRVRNGCTQNSNGNIAGSVITMLDAVRMMLDLGFSETEVAQMSSLNPARLLQIDHDCGSIAERKRADLVALDAKRQVRLTMIGGQIAFQDLS